jgi:Mor family transcriptional regulator
LSADLDADVSLMNDLVRAIRESLGLPEMVAMPMAQRLAPVLRHRGFMAEWRDIPASEIRQARDERIANEFDGRNHKELARRYGVGRATVYRAISRAKVLR